MQTGHGPWTKPVSGNLTNSARALRMDATTPSIRVGSATPPLRKQYGCETKNFIHSHAIARLDGIRSTLDHNCLTVCRLTSFSAAQIGPENGTFSSTN